MSGIDLETIRRRASRYAHLAPAASPAEIARHWAAAMAPFGPRRPSVSRRLPPGHDTQAGRALVRALAREAVDAICITGNDFACVEAAVGPIDDAEAAARAFRALGSDRR